MLLYDNKTWFIRKDGMTVTSVFLEDWMLRSALQWSYSIYW